MAPRKMKLWGGRRQGVLRSSFGTKKTSPKSMRGRSDSYPPSEAQALHLGKRVGAALNIASPTPSTRESSPVSCRPPRSPATPSRVHSAAAAAGLDADYVKAAPWSPSPRSALPCQPLPNFLEDDIPVAAGALPPHPEQHRYQRRRVRRGSFGSLSMAISAAAAAAAAAAGNTQAFQHSGHEAADGTRRTRAASESAAAATTSAMDAFCEEWSAHSVYDVSSDHGEFEHEGSAENEQFEGPEECVWEDSSVTAENGQAEDGDEEEEEVVCFMAADDACELNMVEAMMAFGGREASHGVEMYESNVYYDAEEGVYAQGQEDDEEAHPGTGTGENDGLGWDNASYSAWEDQETAEAACGVEVRAGNGGDVDVAQQRAAEIEEEWSPLGSSWIWSDVVEAEELQQHQQHQQAQHEEHARLYGIEDDENGTAAAFVAAADREMLPLHGQEHRRALNGQKGPTVAAAAPAAALATAVEASSSAASATPVCRAEAVLESIPEESKAAQNGGKSSERRRAAPLLVPSQIRDGAALSAPKKRGKITLEQWREAVRLRREQEEKNEFYISSDSDDEE